MTVAWRIWYGPVKNTIYKYKKHKIYQNETFKIKRFIMKEFNYTITDKEGIHMRPAGELVKAAKQFESSILIKKDGKTADCKKVFTIMSLAVKCGQEVTVNVEGTDEEQAAAKIEEFMKGNM